MLTPNNENTPQQIEILLQQQTVRIAQLEKDKAIEVALDNVRTRTMAMRKSQELSEVVTLMHKQLRQLGAINEYSRVAIGVYHEEKGVFILWVTTMGGAKVQANWTFSIERFAKWSKTKKIYDAIESQDRKNHTHYEYFKGEEFEKLLASTYKSGLTTKEELQMWDDGTFPREYHNNLAFFSHGEFTIGGIEPLNEAQIAITMRFAAVFEQVYTRFLDLQKAEEQNSQIAKVLEENQRLLYSILPAQIAERIQAGQQTIVKRFEQVSILFADIVGFTALSEKITPQEVVDILNGLFSKFDDLTDKYQLEKIKTIGDAYMVASGVPEDKENHVLVLFQFAQEMLESVQDFNRTSDAQLKMRVGISSGPVVAGVIGKKKFTYDLWGDTVNTAARMEAYGREDCIQVSPASYAILKKDFVFEKISNMEVKGKGLMDVYLWAP